MFCDLPCSQRISLIRVIGIIYLDVKDFLKQCHLSLLIISILELRSKLELE